MDAPAELPTASILKSVHVVVSPLVPGYDLDSNRAEEANTVNVTASSVIVAIRPAELSQFQIEERAFAWLTGAGRCAFKPVPDELRVQARKYLIDHGVTRAEMTERLTRQFSNVSRYTVTESDLLSREGFASYRAALDYLGSNK